MSYKFEYFGQFAKFSFNFFTFLKLKQIDCDILKCIQEEKKDLKKQWKKKKK